MTVVLTTDIKDTHLWQPAGDLMSCLESDSLWFPASFKDPSPVQPMRKLSLQHYFPAVGVIDRGYLKGAEGCTHLQGVPF